MKHLIPATAQPSETIRNDASLLIPGREEPIKNASLVAYKNKIEFVGEKNALPDHFKDVMPTTYSMDDISQTLSALASARGARDMAATLNAGFTSVRELGGYGISLSRAVEEAWLPGP
ncbi:hypothetical protein MMC20_005446 [Loxospora ochrophaea]|nr:hypothetical protein [Loxospora ochrophaea]